MPVEGPWEFFVKPSAELNQKARMLECAEGSSLSEKWSSLLEAEASVKYSERAWLEQIADIGFEVGLIGRSDFSDHPLNSLLSKLSDCPS